jgi:hypothetical protein
MSAIAVIEGLIKVGTTIKDAFITAKKNDASTTWETFIVSNEFTVVYGQVSGLLNNLSQPQVTSALEQIRGKEVALLGGQSVMDLSTEKLAQYDALLDVENQLMRKYAANAGKNVEWVSWLVDDALPILIKVAKVVLPILL